MEIEQPFSLSIPIPVNDGGTGLSSLTPYAILAGGVTATSVMQQIADLGVSGQVLTSQGANALPQWTTIPSATPAGPTKAIQYNDSSSFGGDANLTWDKVSLVLGLNATASSILTVAGTINLDSGPGGAIDFHLLGGSSGYDFGIEGYSGTGVGERGSGVFLNPGGGSGGATSGHVQIGEPSNGKYAIFDTSSIATSNKTFTFPNASGTFALTSNIPSGAALTKVDDTNITLSLGGTPSTALLVAASITAGWSGTLAVSRGGTGGGTASITLFNNITGYSAAGSTGTTTTNLVFSTSPTLVTPALGAATATSINGLTVTSTTGTFTLTNAKTLAVTNTITLSGTDSTIMTFPTTTATIARTDTAQTFSGTQTFSQIVTTNNAIAASGNAATVPITSRISTVTNNSAATLTITITTASAVDGQQVIVRILDFSAVAQTIAWVNTENSTVAAPTTSNGSTSLPLSVGFMYNSNTSKWRCLASA